MSDNQTTELRRKLTAEQVRDVSIEKRFDWQAIADELNATMDGESISDLIDRARNMARNIQGNLGRNLYRRKDVGTLAEVSSILMELANELTNTTFQFKMVHDDLHRFIDNVNDVIDEEVRERLDSQ